MSYDVSFAQERVITDPDRNYTSNVSPMWADALGTNLGELIEATPRAGDLLPHLLAGIQRMRREPARYKAMNPPNGWGDYYGALRYLVWMARNCRIDPEATVTVWR